MMRDSFESVLRYKNRKYQRLPNLAQETSRRRVAFILLDNFSLMAFTGAADALVTANLMAGESLYDVHVVGASGLLITSDLGIAISTDCLLKDLDAARQDILIVCGGFRVPLQSTGLLRSKLRTADAGGKTLGGLWNGSFFLADAGLLNGYDCAIHPDSQATLAELYPGVGLSHRSYITDRQRISCAGANSSLGMMLNLIRNECGDELASAIDEVLSCDKTQEVIDVSVVSIDQDPTLPASLKLALALMHNNIEEPLPIERVAQCSRMSRRQLERVFNKYVNAAPARYYLELRLTHARQLLQQTNRTVTDVAIASGFRSVAHFHHCFRQFFRISPKKIRDC